MFCRLFLKPKCIFVIVAMILVLGVIPTLIYGSDRKAFPPRINLVEERKHTLMTDQRALQTTATDSNTTLIGRWASGPCYAVAVRGIQPTLATVEYLRS